MGTTLFLFEIETTTLIKKLGPPRPTLFLEVFSILLRHLET
jgi:hypothetical protein